jgi:hypothetical protein
MNPITNNPFRTVGVYSNATLKEIAANKAKLNAYLKVGKSVEFSTDLNSILPPIERTPELIDHSLSKINLPLDKLKHAMFWFINVSKVDEIALNHLNVGDVSKAFEILDKKSNYSTLLNKGIVYLINKDYNSAIENLTELIHNEDHLSDFIKTIAGDSVQITEDEVSHLFIDTLLIEKADEDWIQIFFDSGNSADDDEYLKNKFVNSSIKDIESKIAQAKVIESNNAKGRYNAGTKLIRATKEPLQKVQELLDSTDMQYQLITDKLAKEILQCGIDYYNNTNEKDAIFNAMALQKYALDIAVGQITKARCKENVQILQKTIDNLPPVEVSADYEFIEKEISKFNTLPDLSSYSINLIINCAPYLVVIKEKLGKTSPFYIKVSTRIAGLALHNIIEEVNTVNNENTQFQLQIDRSGTLALLKRVVKEAWHAIIYIDKLDLANDFKNDRFLPNRESLKSLSIDLGISTGDLKVALDMRTETEFFNSCSTSDDFNNYIKKYPNGKFLIQAKSKFNEISAIEEQRRIELEKKKEKERIELEERKKKEKAEEDKIWSSCQKLADYEKYLSKYRYGNYSDEANRKISSINRQRKSLYWLIGISAILIIVLLLWGVEGVGVLFGGIAFLAFFGAIGKGDVDGETRLIAFGVSVVSGLISYGIFQAIK